MKITCLDKDTGQMLGESFYKIPRFQRPYSWDHANLEEFWNDTIVENDSDYFIGNFVVYGDKGVLGIVDGQQRLTTITLMLCALRNALKEEGFSNLAKGIHNLVERSNIKNERFYVLQTESSYPFFQEYVQKFGRPAITPQIGPEEKLLKEAFDYLRGNIEATIQGIKQQPSLSANKKKQKIGEELSRIRDKVLGLKLIFTSLDNEDDAYLIFETLNTRGKDLTLSDLVKSHLARLLKPSNKAVDLTKDKWTQIAEIFEESQADLSVSTFIHHFWLSRYDYVTEKKLYKALRKRIKKDNAGQFLDDLLKEAKIYRQIYEPTFKKWRKEDLAMRDSLEAMSLFRVRQQLPLVLAVMRHYEDAALKAKKVREVLSAIENFHFVFTSIASQRSSGGISFMYASAAKNLHEAKSLSAKCAVLDSLYNKLKSKRPPYAEFEARFLELRYSSKFTKQRNLMRYLLAKIQQANSSGAPLDLDRLTLEHIAPENPQSAMGLSDEQVASVGNLIVVDQRFNNKLANKDFPSKRKILQSSSVYVDQCIAQAKSWGAMEIDQRARFLADQAYNRDWKL
ncbi:MAG TPA: DUF262 domain-containing HNH endonuclease family protein [Terriglobia bacterium]|nr:DUF262 domain-containing HNH endonuclease family protein [Terriglobia bacterium]